MTVFLIGLVLLGLAGPVGTQTDTRPPDPLPPDTLVSRAELPEVTVVATRRAVDLATVPARVSVLDRESVDQTGATSVAELLGARSGAFLRRLGPTGLASLSLRGMGASQTTILLDGTRITDPQLGQLDLSLLPTAVLESVEVMHGASSSLYGSDGMGGAVNLRTRTPSAALDWQATAEGGAFGMRSGSAVATGGQGPVQLLGAAEYRLTDGDFPFVDETRFDNQTTTRRRNADREQVSLFGSAALAGDGRKVRLSGWYTAAERGLPGVAGVSATGERQADEALRLWADGHQQLSWGRLRVGGLLQHKTLRYQNPALTIDDTGRTLLSSVEAEATVPLSARWLVSGGLTATYSQAAHPSLASNAREGHGGAFAQATGQWGRLLLYPALRADTYRLTDGTQRTALSPRLGLNMNLPGIDGLRAKASMGRAFRVPTFNDRFWQPGGNPDLKVERGLMADAGLLLHRGAHRAEVTVFQHQVHDQIVWQPDATGTWTPRNLQRVRSRGAEASYAVRTALTAHTQLDAGLHLTRTQALNRSDPDSRSFNKQLRYVPQEEWKAHAALSAGIVSFGANVHYTGRRFITADESRAMAPHAVVDGHLRVRPVLAGLTVGFGLHLNNLFDTDYAIIRGYPMPPRHLHLRLTVQPSR